MYQPTAVFQHVRARISTLFYIKTIEHDLTNIVITTKSKETDNTCRHTIRTFRYIQSNIIKSINNQNDKWIFGNGKTVRSQPGM